MPPARPTSPAALEFQLTCQLEQVRGAGERVRAFLSDQGWSPAEVIDCELALVEACNNAIKYARMEAMPVSVRVVCQATEIEMRVTDHTAGFDWPEKASPPNPEAESGRGVYLIKALMDVSSYMRGKGENTLVMQKRRVPA
jgi:anti-sigma regulatory factor (Ser/Thr protein kinase)